MACGGRWNIDLKVLSGSDGASSELTTLATAAISANWLVTPHLNLGGLSPRLPTILMENTVAAAGSGIYHVDLQMHLDAKSKPEL